LKDAKDKNLLALLQRQDPTALPGLIDKYAAYVGAIVYNVCVGRLPKEDMEETAADVFLTLWKNAGSLDYKTLKQWLGTVARNTAKNRLRTLKIETELIGDEIAVSDDLPEDRLSAAEEREKTLALLAHLGEPDRELFIRHYYWGQTLRAISEETQLNENTIKTKLARGRERLREIIINGENGND
jgi:RNA polymerase sigma-70 factor (ECF subfamily)